MVQVNIFLNMKFDKNINYVIASFRSERKPDQYDERVAVIKVLARPITNWWIFSYFMKLKTVPVPI